MKLDLHTHTKHSDGELSVKGNIERAKELGLNGIAITDHDNIDSWKEIDKINDFLVIKGVELSTFYKNENIHLLGYYLNNNESYDELEEFLNDLRSERKERINKMIKLLKQFKIELTEEEILKEAKSKNLIITGGSDFHGPVVNNSMGLEYLKDPHTKVFLKKINK